MSQDGRSVAKFLQGALAAICMLRGMVPVKIADVEQETDAEGIYKDYFVIVTESGLRIRVTVQEEKVD